MTQPDLGSGEVAPETAAAARPKPAIRASDSSKRIPELDGLRGIAIGLVVLFHSFYFGPGPDYHTEDLIHRLYVWFEGFIAIGWSGVDLFFVLSGFLIGGILLDARESPRYYRTFYIRRFFRIIPPYYAWIIAYVVVRALAGHFLRMHIANGNVPGRRHVIWMQLLFLQNFGVLNGYAIIAGAGFWPTWSLAVDEQFYLIAPAVIRRLTRGALFTFIVVTIVLAPLLRILIYFRWPGQTVGLGMINTLMPCRADALGIGVLAALLWRDEHFRDWVSEHIRALYALAAIFLAGLAILGRWWPSDDSPQMQTIGYTWIAGFFVLIMLLALANPAGIVARVARSALLRELGRVSYCLYLIHYGLQLLGQTLLSTFVKNVSSWEGIAARAVTAVISYGIARVSWEFFEHPLVKRGRAFKY
jgi:peptidoglycan/LPS O-acetylase OafA/YrhL